MSSFVFLFQVGQSGVGTRQRRSSGQSKVCYTRRSWAQKEVHTMQSHTENQGGWIEKMGHGEHLAHGLLWGSRRRGKSGQGEQFRMGYLNPSGELWAIRLIVNYLTPGPGTRYQTTRQGLRQRNISSWAHRLDTGDTALDWLVSISQACSCCCLQEMASPGRDSLSPARNIFKDVKTS